MDEKDVQADAVSQETESKGVTPPVGETPPQLSDEERIAQIVKDEVAKQTAEATELAKREIQSAKDKARREVETALGRATFAEETTANIERGLGQLDPEQAELIKLKAEKAARDKAEAMGRLGQQREQFDQSFRSNMTQFITSAGLAPDDKRIDWAEDAPTGDYLARQQRILASVTKTQKEDAKTADEKRSSEFKDMEAKLRKDLGLDSVDTSVASGVSTDWRKGSPEDKIKAGLKEGQQKRK